MNSKAALTTLGKAWPLRAGALLASATSSWCGRGFLRPPAHTIETRARADSLCVHAHIIYTYRKRKQTYKELGAT